MTVLIFLGLSESSSEADSDAPKRKRKGNKPVLPRKRSSNSGSKAPDMGSDSDSEHGIRVTAKSKKRRGGLLVDEIIYLDSAPESWDIPASTNRVAYILDLTDTPELLGLYRPLTLDAYAKKQVILVLLSLHTHPILLRISVRTPGQAQRDQQ
jgi:hypothetical protein